MYKNQLLYIFLLCFIPVSLTAQQINCNVFKPIINIDFGNVSSQQSIDLSYLRHYKKVNHSCPDDGHFAYVTATNKCFNGNWHTLTEDHTQGDTEGKMMLVNASNNPSIFFNTSITSLKAGKTYEISAWFANVCKHGSNCDPTPPSIDIIIYCNGKILSNFNTGNIYQTGKINWQKYAGTFTLPQNADKILLQMKDITIGGCGNDFAMDDIQLKECVVETKIQAPQKITTVTHEPVKVIEKEKEFVPKKVEQAITATKTITKPITPTTIDVKNLPNKTTAIPIPSVLINRNTPIVQTIKTNEPEIILSIYDNGEIDGDTVSIYHNNELIKANAGLSIKPIIIKIKVDKQHPHHEIVMVANNVGSIPPNTSLMIVTAGNKRYEIFISASDTKNARINIDWE
jgi:hypothetical protein